MVENWEGSAAPLPIAPGTPSAEFQHAEHLGLVTDTTLSGVAVVEASTGRFLYANTRGCDLLGLQHDELSAMTWQQVSDPDGVAGSTERTRRLLAGELERFAYRKRVRRGDGEWVYLGLILSVAELRGGQVLVVQVDDMTREGSVSAFIRLVANQPDGDTLARAVMLGVLDGLEIRGAALYRVDLPRRLFVSVGSYGVKEMLLNGHREVPLDVALPIGEVYRTGTEYSATVRQIGLDYPLSGGWTELHEEPDTSEITILPVFYKGLVSGIVVLGSQTPLGQSWEVRNVLDTMRACVTCWLAMNDPISVLPVPFPARTLRVTQRQRDILRLVESGYPNQQIALRLGFSEGTIRSDLLQLTRLLGVRGRQNLVAVSRRAGLLDDPVT
jgi:PAS domain S-box-containing protein